MSGETDRDVLVETDRETAEHLAAEIAEIAPRLPDRLEATPEDVDSGLAQLALTLIELVRQVLEKQAIRRMEGGSLSEEELERLGLTLMRLSERMDELKEIFGLEDEDLKLDLGPLRRLL